VITGATGNVGTSVIRALAPDPAVDSIVGLARRRPEWSAPKTEWATADIRDADLTRMFRGADAVVHLAWLIQPARDRALTRAVNVDGSRRVFDAAARAGVPAIVHASSVGAYSPGPKDRAVDESWPTDGIPTSFYSRDKADVERLLDDFEHEHPATRVARLRPGLIFKREAGSEIRRLFAGPFLPSALLREGLVPILPLPPEPFSVQVVHSVDVGEAFRLAVVGDARGAFNVAAAPVLDRGTLARVFGARPVTVPPRILRGLAAATYRLHLQPSEPGWLDMGVEVPLMDVTRARAELGWTPRHDATTALRDLLAGMRESASAPTPPLSARTGGPLRIRELLAGVGSRTGR
jgi:nucleoside-diphosphate-sugar epimerase